MKLIVITALIASVSAGCDECVDTGICARLEYSDSSPVEGEDVLCLDELTDPICNSNGSDPSTLWFCYSGDTLELVLAEEADAAEAAAAELERAADIYESYSYWSPAIAGLTTC